MFNSSHPIILYRSQVESRSPSRFWVCDWQAELNSIVQNGTFLVEAGHYFDARQTAKKALRDGLIHSLKFTFAVRLASLLERVQLKITPGLVAGKEFAEIVSADSTNKT